MQQSLFESILRCMALSEMFLKGFLWKGNFLLGFHVEKLHCYLIRNPSCLRGTDLTEFNQHFKAPSSCLLLIRNPDGEYHILGTAVPFFF